MSQSERDRLTALEQLSALLQEQISDLKSSLATEAEPGLVRITSSQAVTDSTGKAIPASENNSSIEGSLANRIENARKKADGIVGINGAFLNGINSKITDCDNLPIGYCGYTYSTTANAPGAGWLVFCVGADVSHLFQIAVSEDASVKLRRREAGKYGEWKSILG